MRECVGIRDGEPLILQTEVDTSGAAWLRQGRPYPSLRRVSDAMIAKSSPLTPSTVLSSDTCSSFQRQLIHNPQTQHGSQNAGSSQQEVPNIALAVLLAGARAYPPFISYGLKRDMVVRVSTLIVDSVDGGDFNVRFNDPCSIQGEPGEGYRVVLRSHTVNIT